MPLAAEKFGIKAIWASEIEKFPISVTKYHFPHMEHMGDIRKLDGAKLPPVDITCGGFPCTNASLAAPVRSGLLGEQTGLFFEMIRVIKEMREADRNRGRTGLLIRPRFFAGENVPGLYSCGNPKGEDFRIVIEEILRVASPKITVPRPPRGKWQPSGYVLGDGFSLAFRRIQSRHYGVAQSRSRIFFIADFNSTAASKVLFEFYGVPWNPATREAEGQTSAGDASKDT
jgi:DNA (cytosine-5)-methyltransferase 1